MSIANDIRDALRAAPGPITAKELLEACGNDYNMVKITGNIGALVKSGEVLRDRGDEGFTYLLDPAYVSKRKAAGDVATPPHKKKKQGSTKAIAIKKATREPRAIATQAADQSTTSTVISIGRTSMRALALAVVALHPKPMPPELKTAVLETMQASL